MLALLSSGRSRRAALIALSALLPLAAVTGAVQAQVERCEGADGSAVYTDRGCAAVGATMRPANRATPDGGRRSDCARTLQDLLWEVSTAINRGDTNRLAGVYHWQGMSARGSIPVLDRLGEVVRRPLLNIVPVRPAAPRAYPAGGASAAAEPPIALLLEQTQPDTTARAQTLFEVHPHFGCLWIRG